MKDEKSVDTNEHYGFLEFVRSVFIKSISQVVEEIYGNCSTNRSLVQQIGPTLLDTTVIDMMLLYKAWLWIIMRSFRVQRG